MDLANRLDLFYEVVQQGSFAKAANLRNLDRSALSKQVKALEEQLGVRLLNRSTRSLSLTHAGEEILKQARMVREILADTHKIAEQFNGSPIGSLKITAPMLFGKMYIQKAVNLFMQRYPDIKIKLIMEDKRSDIIGEQFDIAFRIGPPRDSNMIAKKLADTKSAILASKCFIEKYGKPETPEELVQLPSVIYTNGEYTLDKISISEAPGSSVMKTHHITGRLELNEVEAQMDAVQAGLGYAFRGVFALDKTIDESGLVPLLTDYKVSIGDWGIYAIYPHRNQTPTVKRFIETVQDVIGTPPVWESYIENYSEMYN